jgi:putative copper export protein
VLYTTLVFLHVLGACVWLGGLTFFAAVVVPLVRRMPPADAAPLIRGAGERFRTVGVAALAVLVVTGFANLLWRWASPGELLGAAFWSTRFGTLMAVKLALVATILVMTFAHDRSGGSSTERPHDEAARKKASRNGRITMLLSLAVAWIGVMLHH